MHLAGDASGTTRDPLIYKPGEDYYHKDFGSGRNRWGDFSQAQVDPSDDRSLWTLQEYGKNRANTNDGTTGSNGSRWSTWWANVAGPAPLVTISPGPSQNEGNGGLTPFTFTVNLSTGYSLPVTVSYQTSDGTATVADNDYQAATGSIIIPAGETSGTIMVNGVGDTKSEPDETFSLSLISATNGTIGLPAVSTGTLLNDDPTSHTITASAGAGGVISPSGAVSVAQGADQGFIISPDACYHIADVMVDGGSVGAVASYTFTNVVANHTIDASFAPDLSLSIGQVVALEGNSGTTEFDLPVTLSGPCSATVQANWQTADGTAQASDGDYVANSGVVSFAPGITSQVIPVQVNGDLTPEDHETFLVNLLSPVGAGIAHGQGVGMILNDDGVTAAEGTALRDVSFAVEGGNPVGDAVAFRVGLPRSGEVELSIYDVQGRRVAEPLRGVVAPGYHTVRWGAHRGTDAPGSGVYFARFAAAGRTFTRRFVLLR